MEGADARHRFRRPDAPTPPGETASFPPGAAISSWPSGSKFTMQVKASGAAPLARKDSRRSWVRLGFIGLHALRNRNPSLFAAGPDVKLGREPARIVEGSGLDRNKARARLHLVIDPRSTFWAESAQLGSARVRGEREGIHFALCQPKVRLRHDHGHSECAAGLALAVGAMAGMDPKRIPHRFKADGSALTPSCVFGGHGSSAILLPGGVSFRELTASSSDTTMFKVESTPSRPPGKMRRPSSFSSSTSASGAKRSFRGWPRSPPPGCRCCSTAPSSR